MCAAAASGTGPMVLLIEGNALVGLDLCAALEAAGYRVAGPFGHAADARSWLARETPDLALLDVTLGEGSSHALARELRGRGVPFALYSGALHGPADADVFGDAPRLAKPASHRAVTALLDDLAAARTTR